MLAGREHCRRPLPDSIGKPVMTNNQTLASAVDRGKTSLLNLGIPCPGKGDGASHGGGRSPRKEEGSRTSNFIYFMKEIYTRIIVITCLV